MPITTPYELVRFIREIDGSPSDADSAPDKREAYRKGVSATKQHAAALVDGSELAPAWKLREAEGRIRALEAELERVRAMAAVESQDAGRYRKMRSLGMCDNKHGSGFVQGTRDKATVAFRFWCSEAELDATVDAAAGAVLASPEAGAQA